MFGETVSPIPTISVLLIRLPITGMSPHRSDAPIITTACGNPTASTKIAVRTALMAEVTICGPITVAKLW